MKFVAEKEKLTPEFIRDEIASGRMIIPANINHTNLEPIAIGINVTCKINANIGNSTVTSDIDNELAKLNLAVNLGADAVMDLSTGGNLDEIRVAIIRNSRVPIGTVPIYSVLHEKKDINDLTAQDLIDIIEKQAKQGVDFMTIHCALLKKHIELANRRVTGIVSRGGSLMAKWMQHHDKENPLYTHFEDILDICKEYDVSLSLGDGLRPGCLADACDDAQYSELEAMGELTRKCWNKEVQVMIEGPGHVPFNRIEENVQKEIEICQGAPFYVLGPIVTDIAPGYDHITSAIGATMAAYKGASMLCYVTPKEHLGLPNKYDVRQGVIAYKIAAHAADVARNRKGARDRDDEMARARFNFDWNKQFEISLDPETARTMHDETLPDECYKNEEYCSMCGPDFCAMRISKDIREKK